MFTIQETLLGNVTQFELRNTHTGEYFGCIPAYGCTLNALVLKQKGKMHHLLDGSPSFDALLNEGTNAWKGQILFPFPNRLKNGRYLFEGKMYQFDCNDTDGRPNALHGIAQKVCFEVVNKIESNDKAQLETAWTTDETHPAYPFKVQLKVIFTFDANGLNIHTRVTNVGTKNAPFGLGWHPYFSLGTKIDDLEMQLPAHKILLTDEYLIPTGKLSDPFTFLSPEPIENTFLDTGYLLLPSQEDKIILLCNKSTEATLQLKLSKGYDFLQIYTPHHRNSIAIEPQTCAPNAFNNGLGIANLLPEQTTEYSFHVSLI